MPHTKSAEKHQRQSEKRRLRNRATIKGIKNAVKEFLALLVSGSVDELQTAYNLAAKKLDKAAAKRIVHPNMASRKKGQLALKLHEKKTA